MLVALLLVTRVGVLDHPWPVHSDEREYVAAIGFPSPHPVHHPGYVGWVALGTVANAAGLRGYAAYQVWSVLASIAAPVALYLWLRRGLRGGDSRGQPSHTAWWLAAAFGVNPIVWFNSVTALNYTAGCAAALIVAYWAWRAVGPDGRRRDVTLAAATYVFAAAVRPDLAAWLGPLLALAIWRRRRNGATATIVIIVVGLALLAAATAYVYSRGPVDAPRPDAAHTRDVLLNTSVFRVGVVDGLLRNSVKLAAFLAWGFGPAVVLLVASVYWIARRKPTDDHPSASRAPLGDRRGALGFIALLATPLLAFETLIHMSQPGHAMLLAAAGYVVIGVGLQARFRSVLARRLAMAAAVASAAQFVFYPWSADAVGWKRRFDAKVGYLSATGLRHINQLERINAPGDFWRTPAHDATNSSR